MFNTTEFTNTLDEIIDFCKSGKMIRFSLLDAEPKNPEQEKQVEMVYKAKYLVRIINASPIKGGEINSCLFKRNGRIYHFFAPFLRDIEKGEGVLEVNDITDTAPAEYWNGKNIPEYQLLKESCSSV